MSPQDTEHGRLLDHSYDSIQEYDNPLPRWWVWIFWATILFAIAYTVDPGGKLRGPGRIADYERSMAEAAKKYPTSAPNPALLAALANDPKALASGKATFTTTCAPCHRADGGGFIGPNLTDDYWLHGGTLSDIQHTITNGVPEKGMPTWGKFLKPDVINALAVYVYSLHGTNPANAKAPQGVLEPRAK